ncbi:hypothetical protein [Rhizobium sp. SL42]|uniref:hypothetical protein n=1 Tax=Rhizobium sp. SL42 TaxID=2806346 RepID=UPI001F21E5E2|nr:hypothetical protein [Rhizobium sp. SL42]UJW75299.1 hypothetical protein IM739_01925 [Rhizobium sp. SL42]
MIGSKENHQAQRLENSEFPEVSIISRSAGHALFCFVRIMAIDVNLSIVDKRQKQ